jgi:hypothetical protein
MFDDFNVNSRLTTFLQDRKLSKCIIIIVMCVPFNPEPVIFSSSAKKRENWNIQDLPVVLYGCKTWSLTLREEHRLRLFENTVLRKIFGPKRDEVTGGWRKLHNEELRDLYSSPSTIRIIKSRRMRWAGHVLNCI